MNEKRKFLSVKHADSESYTEKFRNRLLWGLFYLKIFRIMFS